MRTPYDWLAKQLLLHLLQVRGSVETEHEIVTEPQSIDVVFVPNPDSREDAERLGLLGRMASTTSMFEAYSDAPSVSEIRDCLRKQLAWHHALESNERVGTSDVPMLWGFAAGDPRTVIEEFELHPAHGWCTGVYKAAPALRLWLVVIPQLPRTRETLTLRLMGRGPTLEGAIDELSQLPQGAWQRVLIEPILLCLRFEISELGDETEMEAYLMRTQNLFDEFCERKKREGIEQGIEQGIERGIEQVICQQVARRFGENVARQVLPLLAAIHEQESLNEAALGIIEIDSGDSYLDLLKSLSKTKQ